MDLVSLYQSHKKFFQTVLTIKNRLFSLRIRGGKGNRITGLGNCMMKNCRICFSGTGSTVSIGELSTLENVYINVFGDGCTVTLGQRVFLTGCSLSLESAGKGSTIRLGDHTYVYNNTDLAATEDTTLTLGEDCLLSSDIVVRTGDSHAILDAGGHRINPAGDITLGNHVWLGKGVTVLKNARIGSGCVVGTGSLITGSTETAENAVLSGFPAKVRRRDIRWERECRPKP